MSTQENDSARAGSRSDSGVTSSQPTLPIFASVRNTQSDHRISHAESSTSGSRKSAVDFQRRSRSSLRESLSIQGSDGMEAYGLSSRSSRRQQNRSSGGFLLEPSTKPNRLSKSSFLQLQNEKKSKRKSEDSELLIPKRRTRGSILDHDVSIGSSPLSSEMKQDDDILEAPEKDIASSQTGMDGRQNGTEEDGGISQKVPHAPALLSVGYDTDPAQIVDMALRLSEGRRRHFSNQRYVSGDAASRRVISSASPSEMRDRASSKSIGQFLTNPRPPTTPTKAFEPSGKTSTTLIDNGTSPLSHEEDLDSENVLEISRATAARVEKARNYLELTYEYRRLLAHLPPIRHPNKLSALQSSRPESRLYNPLQYVRNRKLRLREKSAISGEAEGWHDVEKIRAWVDTVINSHTEVKHDPLECVRLPPLSLRENDMTNDDGVQLSTSLRLQDQKTRPRRPKSDWVTHPGDLLADAHWLEQGLNKTKIQDRDNNQIYPADTQFKFSGWRNVTPIKIPGDLQAPTPPPEDDLRRSSNATLLESAPALPTFRSSYQKRNKKDKKQKSSTKKLKKAIAKDGYVSRKNRDHRSKSSGSETDSISPSTSGEEKQHRGRKRQTANYRKFDLPNGDPFSHTTESSKLEKGENRPSNASDPNLSAHSSKRHSIDQSLLVRYLKRNKGSYDKDRLIDQDDLERYPRSSFEGDSTAPASPNQEVWPSIAINLSPPPSRSPSPTKKSKHSILHSILDRAQSHSRERIDRTDFALPRSNSHSREPSTDTDMLRDGPIHNSRGTSPRTRGPSPLTRLSRSSTAQDDASPKFLDHRESTISRMSTKSGIHINDQPSRIRGMFKGGRIAELVGNEVSRVGDFIWKREVPATRTSFESYGASDTDEGSVQNSGLFRTPTRDRRVSTSTRSSHKGPRLSQDTNSTHETTQYHNPNLPSFTSPFQKDREKQDQEQTLLSPDSALSGDHISQAAAQHRSRSKSPRLDRLAPPKLDTSGSRDAEADYRRGSYGFGSALDLAKPRTASQTYNDAINGITGSSRRSSRQIRKSVVEVSIPTLHSISKKDISRIETLLLMSAVKAKGLIDVQDAIPPRPSSFLQGTLKMDYSNVNTAELPRIRRREEHVAAARNLISILDKQGSSIHDKLGSFSHTTVTNIHSELQIFEDMIENKLTPRVRAAADKAGELSQKLITTSTMAVKDVNDTISESIRMQKRGPLRWLRLLGYGAIEWAVVSLLWIIWFVVTIIRLFLGIVRGSVRVGRWLLWFD